MSKIRVLIIEDSLVVRELLKHIIGLDERFEVVAAVESAEEGLLRLDALAPDVISLDIRLPGMNGLDATLQIMQRRATPIVVVAANVDDDELNIAMNALRAGALSVVEKPVGVTNAAFESMARHLCTQLAIMSQVRVVRQGIDRGLRFGTTELPPPPPRGAGYSVLGLVASTGGPQALTQVLSGLDKDFPLPILLVQHITASFLEGFVSWLSGVTPFTVRIAQGGECPERGVIFVPPADRHLRLTGGTLALSDLPPVNSQRPSGSVLLSSLAEDCGRRGLGVILTGMGSDGAEGMAAMHKAGAYTIAQDEDSCVVYGMPAAAVKLKAVSEVLPLTRISERLRALAGGCGP
ncbi:chemotaxis-specific protein-glutamate methyltransferase CheB [Magnetospirillum sulfuroxidans]|uniref:Protein-glutamate methylesterase/protein-glutamine glutaminase n=1 Tax=Magnetospirillum sulfuroxidans TaxID=611300 RepID=A0ABS5I943_9PROT|nr:chemotaxis-specific protein-glutamate methyltransferase CheB [Magnetospirillum sulfuroxidans]MBR9970786.1 chemotaxis-specific protein-glutamate methyltransferase CheB [Magnetospirillum sulfuroxidans]